MAKKRKSVFRRSEFWAGVVGAVGPIAIQVATGAVTWPVAIVSSSVVLLGYILGDSHANAKHLESGGE